MPERIQLRRTKGWRMPEGAVKVDRSTGWGNPYRAVSMGSGWWATLDLDGRLFAQHTSKADAVAQAVRLFSTRGAHARVTTDADGERGQYIRVDWITHVEQEI